MPKSSFFQQLKDEVSRIDGLSTSKRDEILIDSFTEDASPQAIVGGKSYSIFNSNDYLGLRHHPALKIAEHGASQALGTGPGAVRFISGSFRVHRDLEKALAVFHGRDDAIVFSSAFATNLAVLFSLIKGQSKDSLLTGNVLVLSDELNHRSIIDGIRLSNLPTENKQVFSHLDMSSLEKILSENVGKFDRVVVVTDGVFSMLGEFQNLQKMQDVVDVYDDKYRDGVLLVVDDCHGVAAFGKTGRGTEEVSSGRADVLVGTLGKGFGADGGYVVADQVVIDYLRESSATYIYSNSISPGTAAAALAGIKIVSSSEGTELLTKLQTNVTLLKNLLSQNALELATPSTHPIQPLLIGDSQKTKLLKKYLFDHGFMVTNINYPVVPKGRDEIRIQLSALHTQNEIKLFVDRLSQGVRTL